MTASVPINLSSVMHISHFRFLVFSGSTKDILYVHLFSVSVRALKLVALIGREVFQRNHTYV